LLRSGQRPAAGVKAWTQLYMAWVRQLHFQQAAQESTRLDCLHEVEHMGERVKRLERAIMEAVKPASPALQEAVEDLQALRGIAQISAATIAAELGNTARFESARQLMSYSARRPAKTPAEGERSAAASPRQATRISDASRAKRPGVIECGRRWAGVGQAARRRAGRDRGDCRESTSQSRQTLRKTGGRGQGSEEDYNCRGARTSGLHLGHRHQGRIGSHAEDGSLTKGKNKNESKNFPMRKDKNDPTNEQRHPIRRQRRPQPEPARRRILAGSTRQAQPDSRP
jgi:hypothetical protein